MGKVFSCGEVIANKIPTEANFVAAGNEFLDRAERSIRKGFVEGAFIFGSVAIDAASRRSDLDVLISMSGNSTEHYEEARQLVTAVRDSQDGKVPVNALVKSSDELSEGRHELDRYYGSHLVSPYRKVVGADPAEYITFREQSGLDILSGYIAQKKRRMATTYTDHSPFEEDGRRGLQRMLELPLAVGRKAVMAFAEAGHIEVAPIISSADKRAVMNSSYTLMKSQGVGKAFGQICLRDDRYNAHLNFLVDGEIESDVYDSYLQDMHETIPLAIQWLEKVETTILPKLKTEN